MESDQFLTFFLVLIVITVGLPIMVWQSNNAFKNYLKSQLHPTELKRLETTVKDNYVGTVFCDDIFYELYTDGNGSFYFKKEHLS